MQGYGLNVQEPAFDGCHFPWRRPSDYEIRLLLNSPPPTDVTGGRGPERATVVYPTSAGRLDESVGIGGGRGGVGGWGWGWAGTGRGGS